MMKQQTKLALEVNRRAPFLSKRSTQKLVTSSTNLAFSGFYSKKKTMNIQGAWKNDLSQYLNIEAEKKFNLQKLADELLQKQGFSQLCKEATQQPQVCHEKHGSKPQLQYFAKTKENQELAFDILSKIVQKQLVLEECSLQPGCCLGFQNAARVKPELVRKVFVQNC
jgi:hypothetical protein